MRTLTFLEVRLKRGLEAIPAAQTFRSARFDHVTQPLATHSGGPTAVIFPEFLLWVTEGSRGLGRKQTAVFFQ